MPFAKCCSFEFGSQIQSRGRDYYHERRVSLVASDGSSLQALVAGSSGDYEVTLDWSGAREGAVKALCTCPYFEDRGPCKHLWATMLAADAQGIGPTMTRGELCVLPADEEEPDFDEDDDDSYDDDDDSYDDDDDSYDDDDDSYDDEDDDVYPSGGMRPTRRTPSGWQYVFADIPDGRQVSGARDALVPVIGRQREAWYVLDVSASITSGGLVIAFFQRETRLNGEFGRIKRLNLLAQDVARLPSPEDQTLLGTLLANDDDHRESQDPYRNRYSYYGYGYEPKRSRVKLASSLHESLLPKLCATGRFLWMTDSDQQTPEEDGRPLSWNDGPPWQFSLRAEADDAQQRWLLDGQLTREGEEAPVALKAPALVLATGVLLLGDRLERAAVGAFFPWIAALRKAGAVEVPYKDRWELLARLWKLPGLSTASLPANLRCEEVRVAPQGALLVHAPTARGGSRLLADVSFLYDGQAVPLGDVRTGLVLAEKQQVLVRDRDKERDLLAFLAQSGLCAKDLSPSSDHGLYLAQERLPELVECLVRAGWVVQAEGRLIRRPGSWRLSVTSGIDWFDLAATCDFDGLGVELPALLEALRNGNRFVRLGDGSHGLLPQEWLNQFGTLAGLGEVEGDCIRFRPSQALLLDALLAAQQQVSVDAQFNHVRRKLRSFAGVKRRQEPRGFDGRLREYQKEGLGWLHFLRDFRLGGCLADDMGLGKTVQVLALLQSRRTSSSNGKAGRKPSIVVVPRSLVFNWMEEARRFAPKLRVLDYTGSLRKDSLDRLDEVDLIVTTYGTLHRDIGRLKDVPFDYAILDESQAIKNAHSQRAKACRLLAADHRLAMTGTPVENHLGELWSLFEFLNPGMLGRSATFQALSKDVTPGSENAAVLRRALAPFILRRTKEQVLSELPEKTEQTLHCDLDARQRKHYNELRDYYRASLADRIQQGGMAKAKIHVLEALLRLRQAACHPGLIDPKRRDDPSAKLDALREQLAEVIAEGHKALVFSQFTSLLAIVRRRLDADGSVYEYLDGRTRDRRARVERFQNDPDCKLFLISLKAGGQGLNLTAADYVFILDPWWNPAVEAQAVDRAHRIGQTRRVFAYRLIARDTVEEKVVALQQTKRDLADAIISADASVLRDLTAEDLRMLLS